jgi:ADP-dependent phosphofructokinase/glucokinase
LQVLADHLKDKTKIPRDTPVHLELASIGDATLMKEITTIVVPYVDSLGINEQELGSYTTSFDTCQNKNFFTVDIYQAN